MRETLIIKELQQVEKLIEVIVPNGYIVSIKRVLDTNYISDITKYYEIEITDEILGEQE